MLMDEFDYATSAAKTLVHNEAEFMALFKSMFEHDFQDVEQFLGIEFATVHGHWHDVPGWIDELDDGAEICWEVYRKFAGEARFPEQYPCVVFMINEKSDHRGCPLHVQVLEFIYLTDFVLPKV